MGNVYDPKITQARFWTRVDKQGPDECWLWNGRRHKQGYGLIWVHTQDECAHRFVLSLKLGRLLRKEECALHRCDVPACCNPKHIFLGTKGVNNTDRKLKGRNADRRGIKNTMVKLTPKEVRLIRKMDRTNKYTRKTLAKFFGVNDMTIHKICNYVTWIHI